ncbi:hypothetical protein bpr_II094 (plasmid) [Butyrivibrio proteoclasticus B316]|uniref:Smr domain-containing protein n=1 Tax=Butyrivibrio proteoclasticus (strain ATCC 51982 / DSM 14932 / B316) TaxID=515622 RepID=E0S3Q1_BUTPB|nr:hypothetical protein [Butyrivibrio proteoclasticus]ADL36033.1 hypothetical protein bpr_II094 [Butyrivibrio proteoclasticus B316]
MSERMMFLFSKGELKRIVLSEEGGAKLITVDMHGLSVKEATRLLKNLIAVDREGYDICVIHGFTHGTKIKEALWNEKLSERIYKKTSPGYNPGRTYLKLNAA